MVNLLDSLDIHDACRLKEVFIKGCDASREGDRRINRWLKEVCDHVYYLERDFQEKNCAIQN